MCYAAVYMVKLTVEVIASDVPVAGFISVCCLMSPFKIWPFSGLLCKNSSNSTFECLMTVQSIFKEGY